MTLRHSLVVIALAAAFSNTAWAVDMVLTPASNSGVVIESAPGAAALRVGPTGSVQLPGLPAAPATSTNLICHDTAGTLVRCDPQAGAGAQGPQGVPGVAGPQGAQGPAGPMGPSGTNGTPGIAGAPGATGPAGAAGATGPAGAATLLLTAAEPAGVNCAAGGQRVDAGPDTNGNGSLDVGEINATSYVCNGAQGTAGTAGAVGAAGATGPAGAAGSIGPIGPTGAAGATGPAGAIGPMGPQGLTGATGPAGTGVTGLTEVRHGCFSDTTPSATTAPTVLSGAGYSVTKPSAGSYAVTLTPAMAGADYTVLLDSRASTGRSVALTAAAKTAGSITLARGWLAADAGGELANPLHLCFMLAR